MIDREFHPIPHSYTGKLDAVIIESVNDLKYTSFEFTNQLTN